MHLESVSGLACQMFCGLRVAVSPASLCFPFARVSTGSTSSADVHFVVRSSFSLFVGCWRSWWREYAVFFSCYLSPKLTGLSNGPEYSLPSFACDKLRFV